MRKVVVYELLSLDGVAEDPDSFFTDWDDVMQANLASVIAAQDAVILGHRSYGEWAEFWPGSTIQPFATFINGVAKFVATSAPPPHILTPSPPPSPPRRRVPLLLHHYTDAGQPRFCHRAQTRSSSASQLRRVG